MRRPSWVSLTTPISSALKVSSPVVGARRTTASAFRAPPAGVHPSTTLPCPILLVQVPGWLGREGAPEPRTRVKTLHSLGLVVLAQLLGAHSGAGDGLFMGSQPCSPDPTKSHFLPVAPHLLPSRPSGNDCDRVHGERVSGCLPEGACPALLSTWAGRGKFSLGDGRS